MASSHPFLNANIDELLNELTIDEKISLLAGPDWWNTSSIPRLNIPSVRMSDGPNGVRGSSHLVSTPAQCIPCETCMAASFDEELIGQVGAFLAEEAKLKQSTILLAPTCNIQRHPAGGRAFESFSEDPFLSGTLAASYINGLQSNGVSATIKHFVANDQENERCAVDSVMSERALREIYLMPFMIAQRKAKPWAFMTSYGRIDGIHCSENQRLLGFILRREWGFDGLVMSDWNGTYGVDGALNAGLDLEMPGPPRWRTPTLVKHTMSSRKLLPSTLDTRARTVLKFVQHLAKTSPEIVLEGDGVERSRDLSKAQREFCRKVAADGIVLLKNEESILPISPNVKKIAIIGPNAKSKVISGGGSAALKPTYVITPYEGIASAAPKGTDVTYHVGCYAHRYLPTIEDHLTTASGEPGWTCAFYNHSESDKPVEKPIETIALTDTRIRLNDHLPEGLTTNFSCRIEGKFHSPSTGKFEFGLAVAGRANLYVNGKKVIDNWDEQRPGEFFYGQGSVEEKVTLDFQEGKPVDIRVEYTNTPPPLQKNSVAQPSLMRGVRLGGCPPIDPDEAIKEAAKLASESNLAVLVVGLTPEWESEGFDRPTLDLPTLQPKLIEAVAKAQPRTVVCVQAGSAVNMLPWSSSTPGLLQCWYGGNETGSALASILFGHTNPSGRLPITIPKRVQDVPAHLNWGSEQGKVHYAEDLHVGYKWYEARGIEPLFPFGFGLSYTSFELSNLSVGDVTGEGKNLQVHVSVFVKNTGSHPGSEVVQLYLSYPSASSASYPRSQLRAFAKVKDLKPGDERRAEMVLDKSSFSRWDTEEGCWTVDKGVYGVRVGRSSVDSGLNETVELRTGFTWRGL